MIRPRCQRRLLSRRLLCVNSSSRRASRSVSSAASRTVLSSVSSASANSRPGSCCRTSPVRRSLPSASGPAHFLRQNAELRQVFGVHAPQDRSRAFDAGQCCRRQGHGGEPPLAAPFDFGFGEPRGAYHARHAVAVGDGAGVGERRQRQVGRQQRTGEVLDGRCHGYSVLTLMEPMLSMVTSWAADAL